jgi:hypothetical protein
MSKGEILENEPDENKSDLLSETDTIEEMPLPEIKKRGRKKKVPDELAQEEKVDKIPKKRGRKARGAKLIIKTEENVTVNVSTSCNVILHLKCCLNDLNEYNNEIQRFVSDPLVYNPNLPPDIISYNEIANTTLTIYNDTDEPMENNNENMVNTVNNDVLQPFTMGSTMSVGSKECNKQCKCQETQQETKELNMKLKKLKIALYKNNIKDKVSACFWCTFDFDNPPCYIPKHEINGIMYGYGSFCRPECAVAYLFKENIDDSSKFERFQLLNNIYGKVYDYKKNIKPAPDPHYLLEKFYGQLSIQEYRKLLNTQHNLLTIEKPMTRILPELHDNIDDLSYMSSKNGIYKVKRESEKEQGPTKTSIIRDKFGLTH